MIITRKALALAALASALFALPFGAQSQVQNGVRELSLKFGYQLARDHPQGQGVDYFVAQVLKKSDGKIKINAYPNAVLGSDVQQQAALQGGIVDLNVPAPSTLIGTVKELGIFDFPFLFSSNEEAYAFLDGPVGQRLLEKLPEKGLVPLAYWENGWRHFTSSKKPFFKVEDFAGQKIRTMQSPVYVDLIKSLHGTPVSMSFGELFAALESRAVDAQENPVTQIDNAKLNEVQKYLSLTGHSYHPLILLFSKKRWDQLTPQEQEIIRSAATEARDYQRRVSREAEAASLQRVKDKGMIVNRLPDEEKARLKQAVQPIVEKYVALIGEQTFRDVQDELRRINGK